MAGGKLACKLAVIVHADRVVVQQYDRPARLCIRVGSQHFDGNG